MGEDSEEPMEKEFFEESRTEEPLLGKMVYTRNGCYINNDDSAKQGDTMDGSSTTLPNHGLPPPPAADSTLAQVVNNQNHFITALLQQLQNQNNQAP
ncbi:hypothetical protein GUJ93_ZPchr0002g24020 [Zizania palustris]|uniref:Uncharacterized protein n=1 Tax=Zizania palustris TaxID=103762 RepID=A0A8J5VHQ6_ZIZPA|nr:hypothetical protein GUJ93_ZPchr0002g24020 [Zizania palustris]